MDSSKKKFYNNISFSPFPQLFPIGWGELEEEGLDTLIIVLFVALIPLAKCELQVSLTPLISHLEEDFLMLC